MLWTEVRRMTHEGEECCCHSRPPCNWCSAMTEQELDAWGADGMDGLNALWSAMDGLEPVLDAATARAAAAEARAAQAEADARLMLAELYYADERCIFDDRLPLDERTAVSGMARAHVSTPRAAWVEAVRRILAAGGAA